MTRTPEQVAADEALTAAIEAVQMAYHGEPEGVLTTYVVVAKRRWWDEEGDSMTAVYIDVRDGDMPPDEQLGLVEYAAARIRRRVAAD